MFINFCCKSSNKYNCCVDFFPISLINLPQELTCEFSCKLQTHLFFDFNMSCLRFGVNYPIIGPTML